MSHPIKHRLLLAICLLAGSATAQEASPSGANPGHPMTAPELMAELRSDDATCKQDFAARATLLNNLTPPPVHGDDAAVLAYVKVSRREIDAFGQHAHALMQAERDCIGNMRASIDRSASDVKIQMRVKMNPTFARGEQIIARADRSIAQFVAASASNFDLGQRMLGLSPEEKANPATRKKFLAEMVPVKQHFQAAQDEMSAALDELFAFVSQSAPGEQPPAY